MTISISTHGDSVTVTCLSASIEPCIRVTADILLGRNSSHAVLIAGFATEMQRLVDETFGSVSSLRVPDALRVGRRSTDRLQLHLTEISCDKSFAKAYQEEFLTSCADSYGAKEAPNNVEGSKDGDALTESASSHPCGLLL